MDDPEIIDFLKPDDNTKILFIAQIPLQSESWDPEEYLFAKFSQFGLIHELRVVENSCRGDDNPQGSDSTFGFVEYYSSRDAARAQKNLTGRLFVQGRHLSVKFSTKKRNPEKPSLFYSKCFDLANHYLGFNGWTLTTVKNKADIVDQGSETSGSVVVRNCVRLSLHRQGLSTLGFGVKSQCWNLKEVNEKSMAIARCHKQSYHVAIQDAFSKVLLVVLANGKVYPEINTTIPDPVSSSVDDNLGVLKVNELDEDPDTAMSDEDINDTADMDAMNKHILAQLIQDDTM